VHLYGMSLASKKAEVEASCEQKFGSLILSRNRPFNLQNYVELTVVERLRNWSRVALFTIWNRIEMGGPEAQWIGGTISNTK